VDVRFILTGIAPQPLDHMPVPVATGYTHVAPEDVEVLYSRRYGFVGVLDDLITRLVYHLISIKHGDRIDTSERPDDARE